MSGRRCWPTTVCLPNRAQACIYRLLKVFNTQDHGSEQHSFEVANIIHEDGAYAHHIWIICYIMYSHLNIHYCACMSLHSSTYTQVVLLGLLGIPVYNDYAIAEYIGAYRIFKKVKITYFTHLFPEISHMPHRPMHCNKAYVSQTHIRYDSF